jgi:hypothetical protein
MSASSRRAGIHPRVMAGFILYGLSLGIRSSRKLEDAAANRLDFIWLLEGRVPDHATICKFRTQFGGQINRHGTRGTYHVYQSVGCGPGAPGLAGRCLSGKSPTRRLCRDEHEPLREAMALRMDSAAGRERHKKRAAAAERAFAVLKAQMNFRSRRAGTARH